MAVGLIVIATSCQRDGGIIGRDWLRGATGFSSPARCTLGSMTPNTIAIRIASLLVLERADRTAAEVGAEQLRCDVLAAMTVRPILHFRLNSLYLPLRNASAKHEAKPRVGSPFYRYRISLFA